MVNKNSLFPLLVELIADLDNQDNKELMAAVTGAVWKCATFNTENVARFQELELMQILIQLLRDNSDALDDLQFNPQKMAVLTNVVGAMAECTVLQANIGNVQLFVNLIFILYARWRFKFFCLQTKLASLAI